MTTKDQRVTVDPTRVARKRGGMSWVIQPGLPPVVTIAFMIVFLFTWSLFMNVWFQLVAGPVIMYFAFLLGREYQKRKEAK